jgi:hypothetical protein
MLKKVAFQFGLLIALPALAQQSTNFGLTESVFNAGGHPKDGIVLASTGFRLTLDAVGEGVARPALSSPSFRMDGGFPASFPPPGEVLGLGFSDPSTLFWAPERSVGRYNVYRDDLASLPDLDFGICHQDGLQDETADEPDGPSSGETFFYLVTAENRLNEEGTKGTGSGGFVRPNTHPCP